MNQAKFNRLFRKYNKSKKAFEQIYSEYYPQIVLHLKRRFGNLISAEDIAQEFFLKLLSVDNSQKVDFPTAWLYKLCDNMAIDEIRSKHTEIPIDDLQVSSNINALPTDEEVKKYFMFLDETSQKILYMYYWEGYSLKEIAAELNISYSNTRTKACRAYKKFKEKM